MKNDTDLPQSVTILEHVQKPTKQRFFVLGILFVSLSIIYLDRVNISIIAANTHFLNEMHLNDKPILVGLLMSLFLASYGIANVFLSPLGDYIGPRRAMLIAYVVISLSLLIGGLSSFFAILLGTRKCINKKYSTNYHLESRFCVTIPVKHLTDSGYSW
ncbi:MFS transporter [Klebsiella pneumoniae]